MYGVGEVSGGGIDGSAILRVAASAHLLSSLANRKARSARDLRVGRACGDGISIQGAKGKGWNKDSQVAQEGVELVTLKWFGIE